MSKDIKLNTKGFILFDGLVSFILLSGFIIFFIPFISIEQAQKNYTDIKLEALDIFKNNLYYHYENLEYEAVDNPNIIASQDEKTFCIKYKEKGGYDKYCKQ